MFSGFNQPKKTEIIPELKAKPVRKPLDKPLDKPVNKSQDKYRQGIIKKTPKVPSHFHKNSLVTYSESEIRSELEQYPGLLKTLGHAYEYEVIVTNSNQEKDYWFCRNIQICTSLLKYFNEQGWQFDYKEKPFSLH
jgi:hypothetical protein